MSYVDLVNKFWISWNQTCFSDPKTGLYDEYVKASYEFIAKACDLNVDNFNATDSAFNVTTLATLLCLCWGFFMSDSCSVSGLRFERMALFGFSGEEGRTLKYVLSMTNTIELLASLDPTAINVQDNDGNTPLHYAARSLGRHNMLYIPVLQLLCDRGGDASMRINNGETPLHTLFRLYNDDTSHTNQDPIDIAAISILLAYGASSTETEDT
ncbi:hypothetical protein FOYG_13996 [Fusarium oxysporum NRRL 32931]|uniref:Uncharacterized protein n=1 Tax=Fusarium oxysporum NRRL 32931 TaxID=660029 RepID=W9HVJ8_FUSOX|nr:hypothetical protein FOYG_13996 [Fusarium oxysporum NRRL 32931]